MCVAVEGLGGFVGAVRADGVGRADDQPAAGPRGVDDALHIAFHVVDRPERQRLFDRQAGHQQRLAPVADLERGNLADVEARGLFLKALKMGSTIRKKWRLPRKVKAYH